MLIWYGGHCATLVVIAESRQLQIVHLEYVVLFIITALYYSALLLSTLLDHSVYFWHIYTSISDVVAIVFISYMGLY